MPDVSSIPPIIPYGRFSRVRLEGWLIRRGLPGASVSLSPLPACADRRPFAFALRAPRGQPRLSRTEPGRGLDNAPPWRVGCPPPQGSSLRIGLCCPSPSSLNRPHPPRSQAHRDFTALRLIRDAFAVRERLGDPRAVPGFRCPFLPGMPSSTTPGTSTSTVPEQRCRHGLRRE